MTMNERLCEYLSRISVYERAVNRKPRLADSLLKAADNISNLDEEITSGEEAQKHCEIEPEVVDFIDMILDESTDELPFDIHDDYLIRTYHQAMMISKPEVEKLRELKHESLFDLMLNFEVLNAEQKLCLKHFRDLTQRITRKESGDFLAKIQELFQDQNDLKFKLVGEYRQPSRLTSWTIDILVVHDHLFGKPETFKMIIKRLKTEKIIQHFLEKRKDQNFCLASTSGPEEQPKLHHLRLFFDIKTHEVCRTLFLSEPEEKLEELQKLARKSRKILEKHALLRLGNGNTVFSQFIAYSIESEEHLLQLLGYEEAGSAKRRRDNRYGKKLAIVANNDK